jgi:hypothetical protein
MNKFKFIFIASRKEEEFGGRASVNIRAIIIIMQHTSVPPMKVIL